MMEEKKNIRKISTFFSIITIIISLIAFSVLFSKAQLELKSSRLMLGERIPTDFTSKLEQLQTELNTIEIQTQTLTGITQESAIASKLVAIENAIRILETKMNSIENNILDSPERIITIALLKKDMESLEKEYRISTRSLEREISMAYSIMKWVIGTILFSIISLAAIVIFNLNKK